MCKMKPLFLAIASTVFTIDAMGDGKIVIAHRGASGYVPEHTLEAYAVAHAMGADYIEPDLVLTKDKVFVCLHDIHLDLTTNVKDVFPDRKRADGKYYAADFTLSEIKQMSAVERLPMRFPKGKSHFAIPTFVEMIELVQGMNKTAKREAGIYPELKEPAWHRENGLPMEEAFLELVTKHGYTGKAAKIFVQCFESEPLKRMRKELKSELPMVQLLSKDEQQKPMLTEAGIKEISTYANGVGPDLGILTDDSNFVTNAHKAGLVVHPYTLRADIRPDKNESFEQLVKRVYFDLGCDGAFTDFPDLVSGVLKSNAATANSTAKPTAAK
jgi:glycerophosphoryl diester phosphodiesterase